MKKIILGLWALGSISTFAGVNDDIINASLRCRELGRKVESCIPKEVVSSSAEATLTYNILLNCEQLNAPLLGCYDIYSASILRQTLGMNVNESLPHFELQILEDIRNAVSRQDELGFDIKKKLLNH